jgi:hypothetical protein
MAEQQEPFADVRPSPGGFSLPELKWRELLFVGALKPAGRVYVRDPSRPLPPFRVADLFPDGATFAVVAVEQGRVVLRRVAPEVPGGALDSSGQANDHG